MSNGYNRSMFTSSGTALTANRLIFNAIPFIGTVNPPCPCDVLLPFLDAFRVIETQYGENMVKKTYESIPTNYMQYADYYVMLQNLYASSSDPTVLLFLKFVEDTLTGAINSYTIYGNSIVLQLQVRTLQQEIETILSNKNNSTTMAGCGCLEIKKSFSLAPLFRYYLLLYGMPAFGVGFDPAKVDFVLNILTQIGIDPYK
jgi:hypothetical protein